jgi:hypothetical protein
MEPIISIVNLEKLTAEDLSDQLTKQAGDAKAQFGGTLNIDWLVPIFIARPEGDLNLLVVVFGPGQKAV